MEDRQGNGRRASDSWVSKISAVAVVLGMVYAVAAWGIPLAGLSGRVTMLESHDTPILYMTCLMFQDSHPRQVPKVCNDAIQQGAGR